MCKLTESLRVASSYPTKPSACSVRRMLYVVPRCSPAARATSLAFSGRSEPCKARKTLAAATTAPTGLPGLLCPRSATSRRSRVAPDVSDPGPSVWIGRAIELSVFGPSISLQSGRLTHAVQDDRDSADVTQFKSYV